MKVLIIDDSALARAQLRRLLTEANMEVSEQPSAIGATRTIMQQGIEAAVIDVSMPGLSGDRLVGVLRSNRRLRDLIIVVVSGRSWEELESVARASGADALMPKDRVEADLANVLWQLHARRTRRRTACA